MAIRSKPKARANTRAASLRGRPSPSKAPSDKKPAPKKTGRPVFAKKKQPPTETEFAARLPLAAGKKFEALRSFLKRQKGVEEQMYYYGPKTGWAYRYLRGLHSVCALMLHDDRLTGIVALDSRAAKLVPWKELSPAGQHAQRVAHGSPTLLWLDIPLDGAGASDFRTILKAKLKVLSDMPPPPPKGKNAEPDPVPAVPAQNETPDPADAERAD